MTTIKILDAQKGQRVADSFTFDRFPASSTLLPSNIETTHKLLYAIATQLWEIRELLRRQADMMELAEVEALEERG